MNAPLTPRQDLSAEERRDDMISRLTIAHVARIRSLVASGEPVTLAGVADAWTSTLENNELAAHIVRTSEADPGGLEALIRSQIDGAIQNAAEISAYIEVERMEVDRQESADEARADRAVHDRSMALGFALGSTLLAVALFAPTADAATITSKPGASTIVSTTAEVQESMRKLHDIFGSQK